MDQDNAPIPHLRPRGDVPLVERKRRTKAPRYNRPIRFQ